MSNAFFMLGTALYALIAPSMSEISMMLNGLIGMSYPIFDIIDAKIGGGPFSFMGSLDFCFMAAVMINTFEMLLTVYTLSQLPKHPEETRSVKHEVMQAQLNVIASKMWEAQQQEEMYEENEELMDYYGQADIDEEDL